MKAEYLNVTPLLLISLSNRVLGYQRSVLGESGALAVGLRRAVAEQGSRSFGRRIVLADH